MEISCNISMWNLGSSSGFTLFYFQNQTHCQLYSRMEAKPKIIPLFNIQSPHMQLDLNLFVKMDIIWKLWNFITSAYSVPEPLLLSCFFFVDPIVPPPICSNKVMFICCRRKLKPCFMSCRYANFLFFFTVQIDCGARTGSLRPADLKSKSRRDSLEKSGVWDIKENK